MAEGAIIQLITNGGTRTSKGLPELGLQIDKLNFVDANYYPITIWEKEVGKFPHHGTYWLLHNSIKKSIKH